MGHPAVFLDGIGAVFGHPVARSAGAQLFNVGHSGAGWTESCDGDGTGVALHCLPAPASTALYMAPARIWVEGVTEMPLLCSLQCHCAASLDMKRSMTSATEPST